MIADMHSNEKINKVETDSSLEEENQILLLVLSRNHILKYQKMFYKTPRIFLMEILNKRELKQIIHNHSSNIESKYFMEILQKMYCKTGLFFSSW